MKKNPAVSFAFDRISTSAIIKEINKKKSIFFDNNSP